MQIATSKLSPIPGCFSAIAFLIRSSVFSNTEGEIMRSKYVLVLAVAALFGVAALPISAQSNPSAIRGGWPITVGAGFSRFDMNFPPGGKDYMQGATAWADWTRIPRMPKQLGVEAEVRRLSLNPPPADPALRTTTFLGGPIYNWTFSRFTVFGKGMVGYGAIDFSGFGPYTSDSRTIEAAGAGGQYRVWSGVWARADYEYQWWPALVYGPFHPNGLSFSVAYDFSSVGRRY
jgi:hypothetical protein